MRRSGVAGGALGLAVALLAGWGCGAGEQVPAVEIREPADAAAVPGPNVRVTLGARGVAIAPAADERPGTAHHHLFIDRELTRLGDTIPSGVSGIIHLGRGQTDFMILGLSRGNHRVIALLADRDHVPLDPSAADTVRFTVTGGR